MKSAEELENIIIKSENQLPVYLKDIAQVKFGYEDQKSIARSDKLPVVSLDVIKEKGENLLDASDKIKSTVMAAMKTDLPADLKVQFFNDQSVQIRNTVSNLENGIISGVILVVLILLFFLGLRNAMFVGMAIPLSMLLGIMVLSAIGYTMNMIVLFSSSSHWVCWWIMRLWSLKIYIDICKTAIRGSTRRNTEPAKLRCLLSRQQPPLWLHSCRWPSGLG